MNLTISHIDSIFDDQDIDHYDLTTLSTRLNLVHDLIDSEQPQQSNSNNSATSQIQKKLSNNNNNNNINSSFTKTTNSNNNDLTFLTKLYISPPPQSSQTNANNINNRSVVENNSFSNSSSSGCSSTGSTLSSFESPNSPQPSLQYQRKFLVHADFATGLKLDCCFECIVSSQATCGHLILSCVRKLNSYVASINQANITNTISRAQPLEEDVNFYYLCMYEANSDEDPTLRELSLSSDFQVANLKVESNAKLYIKRKKFNPNFI